MASMTRSIQRRIERNDPNQRRPYYWGQHYRAGPNYTIPPGPAPQQIHPQPWLLAKTQGAQYLARTRPVLPLPRRADTQRKEVKTNAQSD